jgi:hemerythrin superfamily protein
VAEHISKSHERGQDWTKRRSDAFRSKFFPTVKALRDEFAAMHIRSEDLDALLEIIDDEGTISPEDIEEIAGIPRDSVACLP